MKVQGKNGKIAKGRYVLLGILILCPLLVIILALLASADLVFRELFIHLFDYVEPIDIFMVCFMIVTMFFASYSFIAMLNRRVIKEECVDKRNQEPVLAITITSVLAFVYLIFCGIQIVYLFLAKIEGLPDGQSYASYARQGFFQLLAVCVLNLAIVLICLSLFRESRVLKGILTVISPWSPGRRHPAPTGCSVHRRLPPDLPARARPLGARGDRGGAGGDPVQHLPVRFPAVPVSDGSGDGLSTSSWPLRSRITGSPGMTWNMWTGRAAWSLRRSRERNSTEDFLYLSELSADAVPVLASEENYEVPL